MVDTNLAVEKVGWIYILPSESLSGLVVDALLMGQVLLLSVKDQFFSKVLKNILQGFDQRGTQLRIINKQG